MCENEVFAPSHPSSPEREKTQTERRVKGERKLQEQRHYETHSGCHWTQHARTGVPGN